MRPLLVCLAVAIALPAAAADLPKRKSGLWEMTMTHEGGPAGRPGGTATMQMCIDEKIDDLTRQMGENAAREMCSKTDFRREGGDRLVADSVCKLENSTATTHMVMTGRLDAEYTANIQTRFDPPMMGMSESRSTIKARWTGPCKPGQRAGDVVMPNGMTINMFDAQRNAPPRK